MNMTKELDSPHGHCVVNDANSDDNSDNNSLSSGTGSGELLDWLDSSKVEKDDTE